MVSTTDVHLLLFVSRAHKCIEYWSNKIKKERAALCTNIVKVVMGLKVNIPGFQPDLFRAWCSGFIRDHLYIT